MKCSAEKALHFKKPLNYPLDTVPITLPLKGSWHYEDPQSIILSNRVVELHNILWLDISPKESGIYLLRKGQDLLILTGLVYFTVSQANTLVERGSFNMEERVYRPSMFLLGGGLLCTGLDRLLRPRKVRVGKNRFSLSLVEIY